MFCHHCGAELPEGSVACDVCGAAQLVPSAPAAEMPPVGAPPVPAPASRAPLGRVQGSKNKTAAGLLAIFLGCVGVHKFYLGKSGAGLVMLLVTLFTGVGGAVMGVVGLVEGIKYLSLSDDEFARTYLLPGKDWL